MATRYYYFLAPILPTGSITARLSALAGFAAVAPTATEGGYIVVQIDDTVPNEDDLFGEMTSLGYTFVESTLVLPVFGTARHYGKRAIAPVVPAPAAGDRYYDTVLGTELYYNGVTWVAPSGPSVSKWGRTAFVDDVNGVDATGAVNGAPFKTVQGALGVVVSGEQVYILPGTYALPAAGITIPAGVAIRGISVKAVTLAIAAAVATTTLVTMGENSRLEDVALSLVAAGHVDLTGVAFPGTTATTAKIRVCTITVDNSTASDVGTSQVRGIRSTGTGTPSEVVDAIRASTITVNSAGLGSKRGVLLDTAAHTFRMRDTNVLVSRTGAGAGSYIGVETNFAGVTFDGRTGSYGGFSADISQTLGTLIVQSVNLINNNANALGFNTVLAPASIVWADSGGTPSNATRFMREGTAAISASEIVRRVPRFIVRRLTIRALTGPGAARTDTWTLRKNGASTTLTVSLTGAAMTSSNAAISIPYSDGDTISMRIVTSIASATSDYVVVAELY